MDEVEEVAKDRDLGNTNGLWLNHIGYELGEVTRWTKGPSFIFNCVDSWIKLVNMGDGRWEMGDGRWEMGDGLSKVKEV